MALDEFEQLRASKATTARHGTGPGDDPYERKPWLAEYPAQVPPQLTRTFENGVAMLRSTAAVAAQLPALYYFDRAITYGELDEASDSLAAALAAQGIGTGDRVAMLCQNIPQFVISQYAVWKLGAILVPCNPMFKRHELAYHLGDSGATALICQDDLWHAVARAAAPETSVRTVLTTSPLDFLAPDAPTPAPLRDTRKLVCAGTFDWMALVAAHTGERVPDAAVTAGDVALLCYTSGTTGKPKGAMNTHGNVVYNAEVYRSWTQLGPGDVVIGMAPFFHITGQVAHVAVAALAGIPLITFYRFDAAECLRLIERWRGSFTVASITAFLALLECPDIATRDLSSMRKLYSGGAPVAPSAVERFERGTGAYIHNVYGMTETTSPSHIVPLGSRAPVDAQSGALSVGVPVPGNISKIVSLDGGTIAPPGEVGELITQGPGVSPGYWGKPEETAKTMRDGYLYTGDVARMDERGYFYIVDRKKDMIIVSGFKVWPREVEDALYQHPAVREAAVIGVPDSYRGETVKAFVALRRECEEQVTPDDLIAFCKERMAAYKYPRIVEILPEIPKTLTGKYLRRDLREREASAALQLAQLTPDGDGTPA